MKYTLIIGIEFEQFKRPATLTVHIGNTFVDTFDLEQDYPPKKTTIAFTDTEKNELYESSKWGGSSWILDDLSDREIDIPTFYKMYEIDEECVEGTLKIRVENSNSDYTNGFMKNSSLVKFPIVSIVPSSFFEDHGKKLMEVTTRLKRVEAKYCNRLELKKTPKEHKWTHHFCRHYWPLAGLFLVRRDNEKHEKDAVRHCKWKIGGNFTAEFPIRQKHKTKYIGSWARREIGLLFSPNMGLFHVGKTLINIYNEDQRSNST